MLLDLRHFKQAWIHTKQPLVLREPGFLMALLRPPSLRATLLIPQEEFFLKAESSFLVHSKDDDEETDFSASAALQSYLEL